MGLDIRWPIGLMFSLVGAMMVIYGLVTANSEVYQRSLQINVNLYWGLVLLVFGGLMLIMAWRGSRAPVNDAQKQNQGPDRGQRK